MTKRCLCRPSFAAVLACCLAGPAWAQSWEGLEDGGRGPRSEAAEAVRRAQARSGGRVLGAERIQFDGRDIMRVKVMDESGRVRYMDDDPSSHGHRHDAGNEPERAFAPRPRGPNPRRP